MIDKKSPNKKEAHIFTSLISSEEKEYFIDNLSMLLTSGMDVSLALKNIAEEVRSSGLKKIIGNLQEDITGGSALWEALEKTNLLPTHIISLIRVAEQSGRLDESLGVIVTQQEKNRLFKSKIRAAMMYPVFVLFLAMIVGIGIAWFILPRLATVFNQLNLELPLITRLLIQLGIFLSQHGSVAVPGFILTISLIFYFIFVFEKTKVVGQFILFRVPGVKKLIQQVELARFGFIMGTLLNGGLPIIDALDALEEASPLRAYKKLYGKIRFFVEDGLSIQESFRKIKHSQRYVPTSVQGLIAVGEQSGHLNKTFLSIAEVFEAKTEITTKNLSVIIEPVMLVIVWLGVVAVALAVILPIYSLVGNLNKPSTARSSESTPSRVPPPLTPTKISTSTPVTATTTVSTPTISPANGFKTITMQTTAGEPRVRALPNTQSATLIRLASSTLVTAIDYQDGWYKVILATKQVGWIKGTYVVAVSSSTPR